MQHSVFKWNHQVLRNKSPVKYVSCSCIYCWWLMWDQTQVLLGPVVHMCCSQWPESPRPHIEGGSDFQVHMSQMLPWSCCSGFSGLQRRSDLIDGDPTYSLKSMRLGKQGRALHFWRAEGPSVWEAGWLLCVMFMEDLGHQSNGVCLPWCRAA